MILAHENQSPALLVCRSGELLVKLYNCMSKITKILGTVAMVVGLALPVAASASTTQTFLTLDGLSNNTYTVGSSVNAKLSFDLTGASTLQSIKWEILNASNQPVLPFECQDVDPDFLTAGSYAAEFSMNTIGGSQGTWKIRVSTYGAAVPGANNNCTGTPDNTKTYSNVLTLTNDNSSGTVINNTGGGSGTGSTGTTGGVFGFTSFADFVAALKTALGIGTTTTPPATGVCAQLAQLDGSVAMGSVGPSVTNLQVFLIAHGGSIPAIQMNGAAYGYFGSQTQGALFQVKSLNGCN